MVMKVKVFKLCLFVSVLSLLITTASAYEYSITNVENYSWLDDLDPYGTEFAIRSNIGLEQKLDGHKSFIMLIPE